MKNKTPKNGLISAFIALLMCSAIYLIVGIIGILCFGDNIQSDVLQNISENKDALSLILMSLFIVIAAMHIPIVFFIGKECVLIIVDEIMRKSTSE